MRRSTLLALAALLACATSPRPVQEPSGAASTVSEAGPTVLTDAQQKRVAELEARAKVFLDAFVNLRPQLLSDGRVVFVSNRDGLPALYVGDTAHPDGTPRRLPSPDERVGEFKVLPDQQTVVFTSDVKSDQLYRIFKVGVDGGGLENLTPTETLTRRDLVTARNVPGTVAYLAHPLSDPAARLMVQRLGETPREVWRAPTTGQLNGVSPDGARLLFTQAESDTRQVLLEIDVRSGTPRRIWPREGTATISEVAFTADGRGILLAIERVGAPPRILLLDGSSLAVRAQFEETRVPTGRVAFVVPSPASDRVVVGIDAGNRIEVRLHDAKTLALVGDVHVAGAASRPTFRRDGQQFALGLATPSAPPDMVSVDVTTLAVTPLRADRRPGFDAAASPTARIVEIPAFDGQHLPLNLYLPKTAESRRLPALVLVHGGPSASAYLLWKPVVAFWTSLGFAVVEPNIRGSTGFGIAWQDADNKEKRADAMRDMESIHAWAKAQPWCDGKQIVVGGISYGGYMALLALTRQPTLWAGGIDGSGMSDLRTMERNEDQTVRVFDEDEFGTIGKDDAVLLEWSPLKDVGKVVAPLFVYQGVHDPVTPRSEADQVVSALRAHRVPVEYLVLESEGHGVVRKENVATYLARSYRFIAEHLGLQ
jgi:protease II